MRIKLPTLKNDLIVHVLLFSLSSLAVQPFWTGFPVSADGYLHLVRLAEISRLVRHGIFFSRLAPDLGYGFSIPVFNYYAPLSYYLTLPWHLLGAGQALSIAISAQLATFLAAAGAFRWLKAHYDAPAAFVAAISYVYAPYFLFDLLHRSALPEIWALSFLPWALWAGERAMYKGRNKDFLSAWIFVTALVLSHNVTALLGIVVLSILLAADLPERGVKGASRLALVLAVPLGATAFFWLPALAEKHFVRIYELYLPAVFDFHHNFLRLTDLFAMPKPADFRLVRPDIPVALSWPQLLLSLPILFFWKNRRSRQERGYTLRLLVLAVLVMFMTTSPSTLLWEKLPLLRFLQFPWRFLGVGSLLLAGLAAAGGSILIAQRWRRAVLLSLFPVITLGLFWLFPAIQPWPADLTPAGVMRFEAKSGAVGTTWTGEYTPLTVKRLPAPDTLLPLYEQAHGKPIDRLAKADGLSVTDARYNLLSAMLTAYGSAGGTLVFDWFYFPGWKALIDGSPVPARSSENGLLEVSIPPGRHHVKVWFGETPLRRNADILSFLTIPIAAAILLFRRRAGLVAGQQHVSAGISIPPTATLAAVTLAITLLLWGGKTFYLDGHDSVWRHSRFDGTRVAGVSHPLDVSFQHKMRLLGYDLSGRQMAKLFSVVLYWRAERPLASDYSVSLVLVDRWGRHYGQADTQTPDGVPTSRWKPDQYGVDRHRLMVEPGAPPGDYTLVVSVYSPGHVLSWLDKNDAPAGTEYSLAKVHVLPPRRPWPPEQWHPRRSVGCRWDGLRLVGFDPPPKDARAGDRIPITLYWQGPAVPAKHGKVHLQLQAADGSILDEYSFVPGRPDLPGDRWPSGARITDKRSFLVPAEAADGTYHLLFPKGGRSGRPCYLVDIDVTAPPHLWRLPAVSHRLEANIDGLATLRGYDVSMLPRGTQAEYKVTLYWQVRQTPSVSYKGFVHLLNAQGRVVGQRDQEPAEGSRPTTGWVPGEIIVDSYRFTGPLSAKGGVEIGMYDPATGKRLIWMDDSCSKILGDHLHLRLPENMR